MSLVQLYNGPRPTTAVLPGVSTGTAIKTMLQALVDRKMRIIEWGISHDGAAAVRIQAELLTTGIVAATVTAAVANDVVNLGDPDGVAPATLGFTLSTTGTGYTASAEGTITESRLFDHQNVLNQYVKQFPLGREPVVDHDDVLRIRVNADTDVNAICYVTLDV